MRTHKHNWASWEDITDSNGFCVIFGRQTTCTICGASIINSYCGPVGAAESYYYINPEKKIRNIDRIIYKNGVY